MCVCEYTQVMGLSQPKISRHLAQLRKYGLLNDRKEGKWVFYSIATDIPSWKIESIALCVASNALYIKPLQKKLSQWGDRPNRQRTCC